jgi:hypothetical protein
MACNHFANDEACRPTHAEKNMPMTTPTNMTGFTLEPNIIRDAIAMFLIADGAHQFPWI